MPSVYDLKSKFQAILRPCVTKLAAIGITANQVTVLAVLLSILGGSLIAFFPLARWPLALLPIILFIRMALNAVDGMLAREFDQKSRLGAILNELGDVLSDVALYLPLAFLPNVNAWWVICMVISAMVVEFTGVVAVQIGSSRRYDGPMGKSDRAFWIGLLATLLAFNLVSATWVNAWFVFMVLLSGWTVMNRSKRALNEETHHPTN